jgi:hypothetical protein
MKIKLQISDYCTIARRIPNNTKVKKTNTLNEMIEWMDEQGFKNINGYYDNDSFDKLFMLNNFFIYNQ